MLGLFRDFFDTIPSARCVFPHLTLVGCLALCACTRPDRSPSDAAPAPSAATNAGPAPDGTPSGATPGAGAAATEIAHVPVGKFRSGSLPGENGRRPDLEPLPVEVELGPFRIDPVPYPGDPRQPPRTGVSYDEAAALCAQRQGRLCTELEWERACKGPTSATYPTGSTGCAPENPCTSGFEVSRLGALPEWTASQFGSGAAAPDERVIRGSPRTAPDAERRCARRTPASAATPSDVGFRCCYGAPNAQSVREPTLGEAYREVDVSLQELTQLLSASPTTAALAKDVTFFRSPDGGRTVFDRGPGESMGFTLTTKPVEWRPERGLHLLVMAGRSGESTSFVVAYHLGGDRKILAGSFVMKKEPGPVALAYAPSIRPRMHFSTCWGCPGETGKILFRPPEEFVLLQP